MVHHDLLEPILGIFSQTLPLNHVDPLVIFSHQAWQLFVHRVEFVIVDNKQEVRKHL